MDKIEQDMTTLSDNILDIIPTNRLILELALRHSDLIIVNREFKGTVRVTKNSVDPEFLEIANNIVRSFNG